MIEVFVPAVAEGHEWVQPVRERDFDSVLQPIGRSLSAEWTPVPVRIIAQDGPERFESADLPWLGSHALVVRERALDRVASALDGDGEFLELDCVNDDEPLWLFNVTRKLDVFNEDTSTLVRSPSSGRVMRVLEYQFRDDMLEGVRAFRVSQVQTLFLTGAAVTDILVDEHVGHRFDRVWESEPAENAERCRGQDVRVPAVPIRATEASPPRSSTRAGL